MPLDPIRQKIRDNYAKLLARYDARIAEVEPVALQVLGSQEQRLALMDLAYLKHSRDRTASRIAKLDAGVQKLRPTK